MAGIPAPHFCDMKTWKGHCHVSFQIQRSYFLTHFWIYFCSEMQETGMLLFRNYAIRRRFAAFSKGQKLLNRIPNAVARERRKNCCHVIIIDYNSLNNLSKEWKRVSIQNRFHNQDWPIQIKTNSFAFKYESKIYQKVSHCWERNLRHRHLFKNIHVGEMALTKSDLRISYTL